MKKITLTLGLLCCGLFASAQAGLEKIIVEKYYVSNAADSIGSVGVLPVGSVTYRIYADMLPDYKFQAIYGVPGTEGDSVGKHELRISTTTSFFNNEDRGSTHNENLSITNLKGNSVAIDSWFSVGGVAGGISAPNMGVLKLEDTTGTVGNADGILLNNDTSAGSPINFDTEAIPAEDGMMLISGTLPSPTFVGISDSALAVFGDMSQVGNSFSTYNGSVACLVGSIGSTASNTVLLGQFTTNGIFSFKLNIQIGTPDGETENYVAEDPIDSTEIVLPSLMYTSPAPVVDTTGHDTSTVGIKAPVASKASISIYPNPAQDVVTIDITNSKSTSNMYSIYDAKGILMYKKQIGEIATDKYTEKLDISGYSQGLYIFVLSLDGRVTSKKITKN